jgi:acyl dehydratase
MQALKEHCIRTASLAGKPVDLRALQERIATVLLEALSFVAPNRIGDSLRDWLARMDLSMLPPAGEAALIAEATAMATTLALFTPSGSGTVAVDRLVRARTRLDPADAIRCNKAQGLQQHRRDPLLESAEVNRLAC